jgi:two-component system sensor histidine kinase QseC
MISIRRQLTRELLGAFLILLGGGLAAIGYAARDEIIEQFDDALRAKALAIRSLTEMEDGRVQVNVPVQFWRGLEPARSRDFFEVSTGAGAPVARSPSLRGADLPWRAGRPGRPAFWNFTLPNGRPGRAMALTFQSAPADDHGEPAPPPELRLVVASDREDLDEALTELLAVGGGFGVLLLVGTLVIVPRVLRRGLQPLERLGEQAARITADSLAERFPLLDLPAELQPIGGRLNDLLARLEQSFERERRFSADLAHELRTPLAELRSLAECALKWPDTRDPLTDRETLAIAQQMEAIVTNLLALARGEQGRLAAAAEPVALAPLAQEVWRNFAARSDARQLRVHSQLASTTAWADPVLLRSILTNLFDNMVDYTPAGGAVTIAVRGEGATATFHLANDTDNLEPADVPKLFDRFWRKESARTGGQHFGLGLALARTLAAAMGWTLAAALDEHRRLVFTLRGPTAAAA